MNAHDPNPAEKKVWYLKKSRLFSSATDDVVRECETVSLQMKRLENEGRIRTEKRKIILRDLPSLRQ